MQFSNFSRTEEGLIITFYNSVPIENVGTIKYFTDNHVGTFAKKEFRWSFNNEYWSAWENLTQSAVSSINTFDNYYFFLQIRYTRLTTSESVTSFVLNYNEGTATPATPRILTVDIQTQDASAIVIHDILQYYKIIPITDASLLNGYPGSYYLNRANQTGVISISSIGGLQSILNNLTTLIYVDGSLAKRDASISDLINSKFVKEASLSSDFIWGGNYLYVDVSVVAGGASKAYVDGSLFARDISIAWLNSNKLTESSLGSQFYWQDGSLYVDVSGGKDYDASINYLYDWDYAKDASIIELRAKDASIDASINAIYNLIADLSDHTHAQDASIQDLYVIKQDLGTYIGDGSLGPQFYWQDGSLYVTDVSGGSGDVTKAYVDASLLSRDSSINYLYDWDYSKDASIVNIKATYIPESSLGSVFMWDSSGYLNIFIFDVIDGQDNWQSETDLFDGGSWEQVGSEVNGGSW